MKSVLSFGLIASFLASALPAHAQPLPPPRLSNWSRVATISAGTRINAVYIGRRQGQQYFISADDDSMTLLMPDRLPRAARKVLIGIAERARSFFTATKWMEFKDGTTLVTPDGIFVKGRRIAALEDVVATVARGDVAEVSQEILVRRRRAPAPPFGPDPGVEIAAAAGTAGLLATYAACRDRCSEWILLAGFIAPIVAVPILLSQHREREIQLVYRAD
jgi:hypothetical protein